MWSLVGQGSDGEDDRVSGLFRDKAAKLRIDDRVLNPGAQSKDEKLQFDPMRICIEILCPERRSFADLDTFAVVSVCTHSGASNDNRRRGRRSQIHHKDQGSYADWPRGPSYWPLSTSMSVS